MLAISNVVGDAVLLPVIASDPDGQVLGYFASGVPAGLSISPISGLISGSPTAAGTSNVMVTVSDGELSASATLSWTVSAAPVEPVPPPAEVCNRLVNSGFELGGRASLAGWEVNAATNLISGAHAGIAAASFSGGWIGARIPAIAGRQYVAGGFSRAIGSTG